MCQIKFDAKLICDIDLHSEVYLVLRKKTEKICSCRDWCAKCHFQGVWATLSYRKDAYILICVTNNVLKGNVIAACVMFPGNDFLVHRMWAVGRWFLVYGGRTGVVQDFRFSSVKILRTMKLRKKTFKSINKIGYCLFHINGSIYRNDV